MAALHPSRLRIWLYGTKSYSTFPGGPAPVSPDWLWRSRRFFDWVRLGRITAARDHEGAPIVSRETGNEVAAAMRCCWFGLDVLDQTHGQRTRVYALVPGERVQEMREALKVEAVEPAAGG